MFKCESCGKQAQSGEKSFQKPMEFRLVTYPYRSRANRGEEGTDDPGGKGVEITKELQVCENCT